MSYRILDLFSGAGGFSLGLDQLEVYKTVIATDFNKAALETFKKNFPDTETILGDITCKETKKKIIEKAKELNVNMVIGGPPCQGFSNKGKKLGLKDPRNFLFLEFYEIVKAVNPDIFVMENVKTMITAADGYFINEITRLFEELDYLVSYSVLNSYDYGVPQKRERAFVIGSRKAVFNFEKMKYSRIRYSVRDAISDLSYLESGEGSFESKYKLKATSQYQKESRLNAKKLYNHVATSHTNETLFKLSLIPPEKGKEYLPENLRGKQKFKTTWGRLEWDQPSPTIDTRFDTPSNGKNTHPELNRAITPREAARIQSFPDKFIFYGNRTSINTQIGNAVPPKMAKAIGESIINQFEKKQLFESNNATLYNDDAYDRIRVLQKEKIIVDHIITDPPFAISQKNNFNTMKNPRKGVYFGDWDNSFDLYTWIGEYEKILDKNGSFIVFCSYRYISFIIEEMESNNLIVKDVIRWNKTNPMPRNINRRYVQDTEFAIWAVKKNAKWVFNKPKDVPYLRTGFDFPVVSGKEKTDHPTQKSLQLMKEIVRIHTKENQLIMDPFMGSGTTGVAALELNRRFIGIEINQDYFEIAKKRIKTTTKYKQISLI
ncbi:DNA (cytosine-5)-methyltransferase 1/site-specific DNA-methyltransferase (adenine-specific) [Cerasibacillus quisquiliarum]|uniref:DNA (cytosine-5-)-methyltransferase n=1 Tax=Cerasibacillus quisquiliarum TaxID=227865 RepID=A0A511UW58_9BACI|nr:DNA (cytosine-5-)-methyltransferase [Cerasibacillus quisquiliarum]MBB5146120.1 DNA (cytosine-5)-methyltransferase 1/site-specific DNA-methyltransferase (adenine-specific) [Cerasibacillus quisquiliarum]GEN30855.1 hypothetical protein CQU01_10930 [Cerasibacillus quisquiliarum]